MTGKGEVMSSNWIEIAMTALGVVIGGGIGTLFLYMAYMTGYRSGYDEGIRSEAREFYHKDENKG